MDLYDIHTHEVLTSDSDEGVPEHYVTHIINTYPLGFEYTKDNDSCDWFSCGIHPWYCDEAEPQLNFLKEIAGDERIVAIGEAGLDKLRGPDMDIQKYFFSEQIKLSEQLQKPLIIHCVKAWEEILLLQKTYKPTQPWIIHGYRGKLELTRQLAAHNFLFSIGERFNADSLKVIPFNKLFCETDVDDTSITDIYENIAQTLHMPVQTLAMHIEENVRRIFPKLLDYKISRQLFEEDVL